MDGHFNKYWESIPEVSKSCETLDPVSVIALFKQVAFVSVREDQN